MCENSLEISNSYLHNFESKNGLEFGFRYGVPQDSVQLVNIFKEVYGWNYLYPTVYNKKKFSKLLSYKNQTWFIVEDIDTKKIVGTGVMERKSEISVCASKTLILNKYQNLGIARVLGTQSVFSYLSNPELSALIRIDIDVRAKSINSQKLAEKIRCIPYGFIPNYNNYADKRNFDFSKGKPFSSGEIEAVMMYVSPIKHFWKIRNREITVINRKEILDFYNIVKKHITRMNRDKLLIRNASNFLINNFTIDKDPYKSCISIKGYLSERILKDLLENYSNWNLVEWRVPTTLEGLGSQHIALNNGFKVVGYDPGSFFNQKLTDDTIVFCKFPNGIDFSQFEGLNVVDKNKPIVNKVLKSVMD